MMNAKRQNRRKIGADLRITKTTRRAAGAGAWVIGTVAGFRFDALVFPEHAEQPEFELGQSRISKLWIKRLADERVVVNFDRGWDVRPTDEATLAVVDFLAATLAARTYGN